jgi:hypothetical protein
MYEKIYFNKTILSKYSQLGKAFFLKPKWRVYLHVLLRIDQEWVQVICGNSSQFSKQVN